ncbi:MAG: hypothetical protein EOO77_30990 [Oxalobacteraceae bacterium]|nr:MAG: hypothetical protein EOO77_30990 [Oxalobacteraceae bacterium]
MNGERAAQFALYATMLILPLAALAARRLPANRVLRVALAWVAIFTVGTVVVVLLQQIGLVGTQFGD